MALPVTQQPEGAILLFCTKVGVPEPQLTGVGVGVVGQAWLPLISMSWDV
jgi:hypothetical protein